MSLSVAADMIMFVYCICDRICKSRTYYNNLHIKFYNFEQIATTHSVRNVTEIEYKNISASIELMFCIFPVIDLEILSKEIYHKFYPQLVAFLPMKDAIFVSCLVQLLPGDLKEKVKSKPTQAEAATYFLDNTIKPAIDCGHNETLLSAMQSFDSNSLRELVQKIEEFQKPVGSSFIAGEKADNKLVG